jgi:putative tricarboxylic transport membrane protein
LLVLIGIYVGATYGGSISAVLVGIPGTGAAAATVLDGYRLALKGEARTALSLVTIVSFIGSLFGMLCLAMFTPMLQKLSLNFTSVEYVLLAIFGVTICGSLTSAGEPIKGWIAGFVGLGLSCVGYDGIYSYPRFTFGLVGLLSGIAMVPALIGLFGIPSVLEKLPGESKELCVSDVGKKTKGVGITALFKKYFGLVIQSGFLGTFIGAIPGVGEDIAAWLSYDTAKRTSKHPEEFGKGAYEGVISAETANNSAIGGAMIPLLSLGVPGSAPTAVLLGALMLHGIRPGPMLQFDSPNFILEMCALLILASFCMRVFGWLICQVAPRLLNVPVFVLMPIVAVLSVVGSYAININRFDTFTMLAIGAVGYILMKQHYPAAPVVLGLILGSMADTNLRRVLVGSRGSLLPFVNRPVAVILLIMIALSILSQISCVKKFVNGWIRKSFLKNNLE